jgi:hypothetical protein
LQAACWLAAALLFFYDYWHYLCHGAGWPVARRLPGRPQGLECRGAPDAPAIRHMGGLVIYPYHAQMLAMFEAARLWP